MLRVAGRYRLIRRRAKRSASILGKGLQEVLRYLQSSTPAVVGTSICLAVGLAVIFTHFMLGLALIFVAASWGAVAWLVSNQVRHRKPHVITSKKPQKIEEYKAACRRYWIFKWSVPTVVVLVPICFLMGHLYNAVFRPPTPTSPVRTAASPTALYIGCELDHIPISIQQGTSIHVMWLDPTILRGNPTFPGVGPFDDIAAPAGQKTLTWPTKEQGRWMKDSEMEESMKLTHMLATPYAYHCTLNNYAVTLDEITAQFLVDTSDNKRHAYDVPFNPSVLGHPFEFYIVNRCSSEVVPQAAQWGETATVRILGETTTRRIPLHFERKAFPSGLMPMLGASWFIWDDRRNGCKWDP